MASAWHELNILRISCMPTDCLWRLPRSCVGRRRCHRPRRRRPHSHSHSHSQPRSHLPRCCSRPHPRLHCLRPRPYRTHHQRSDQPQHPHPHLILILTLLPTPFSISILTTLTLSLNLIPAQPASKTAQARPDIRLVAVRCVRAGGLGDGRVVDVAQRAPYAVDVSVFEVVVGGVAVGLWFGGKLIVVRGGGGCVIVFVFIAILIVFAIIFGRVIIGAGRASGG